MKFFYLFIYYISRHLYILGNDGNDCGDAQLGAIFGDRFDFQLELQTRRSQGKQGHCQNGAYTADVGVYLHFLGEHRRPAIRHSLRVYPADISGVLCDYRLFLQKQIRAGRQAASTEDKGCQCRRIYHSGDMLANYKIKLREDL